MDQYCNWRNATYNLTTFVAAGTAWVFRDESVHMAFAFEVLNAARREESQLFDAEWVRQVTQMIEEAKQKRLTYKYE
jgi:ribonucleotide reductase beta subunit family protein with ferritin-like domain